MSTNSSVVVPRRALATRQARWALALAHRLALLGVRPNAVSIASVGCALVSAAAFVSSPRWPDEGRAGLLLFAAAGIQLRLLCNLLDGLLAVEEGLQGSAGEIYNDLPDRLSDVLLLVGAGYAAADVPTATTVAWAAAVAAVFTAYVRVLAGSVGLTPRFLGPMAKQHRMFTLTAATLASAVEVLCGIPARVLAVGLWVITVGSIVTAIRRTRSMLQEAGAP